MDGNTANYLGRDATNRSQINRLVTQMARVLGVGGISFKSPDSQKLSEWYTRWLGAPVETGGGMSLAMFQPGSLPANSYTVWSPFEANTTYFAPSDQAFVFNLVVDDLEQALEQVKAGGAQVVGEPA